MVPRITAELFNNFKLALTKNIDSIWRIQLAMEASEQLKYHVTLLLAGFQPKATIDAMRSIAIADGYGSLFETAYEQLLKSL